MIRVLHYVPGLAAGGAERLLVTLARHLDRDRFSMRVAWFRDEGPIREALVAEGVRVERVRPRELAAYVASERIDVVHSHLWRADLVAGSCARRGAFVPWITTRHNTRYFRGLRAPYGWIERAYRRRASAVIAVSGAVATELARTGRGGPAPVVVPNGVELPPRESDTVAAQVRASRRRELGLRPDEPALLHVGSFTAQKGHEVLLRALQRLAERRLRPRLVLAGDGPLRGFLEGRLRRLGLADQVLALGFVEDPVRLHPAFDLFVFPSRWEGFGLALAEAMASGLAPVASRVDGIPELIVDGESGVLVRPRDPEALAGAVQSLLADPERRSRLATAARAHIAEHFTAERMTRAHESLYERIHSGDPGG